MELILGRMLASLILVLWAAWVDGAYRYTFPKIEFSTSNENILNVSLRIAPDNKCLFRVTGDIWISEQANDLTARFKMLKSATSMQYDQMKKTLFNSPKKDTDGFMDEIYSKYIMAAVKNCSNLPQYKGRWRGRNIANYYRMENCPLDTKQILPIFGPANYCLLGIFGTKRQSPLKAVMKIFMTVRDP